LFVKTLIGGIYRSAVNGVRVIVTIIEEMSPDLDLDGWTETYLHGFCYVFAIAAKRLIGWPMVGIMDGGLIWHAGLRNPDGMFFDARGLINEKSFGAPFGFKLPYDLKEITEEDLLRHEKVNEHFVARAGSIIELRWPELVTSETSLRKRMKAFVDDLENLCHRHKMWLPAPHFAATPRIRQGDGTEAGYRLAPTPDSLVYTMTLYFKERSDV
jgi:hypothetical protein